MLGYFSPLPNTSPLRRPLTDLPQHHCHASPSAGRKETARCTSTCRTPSQESGSKTSEECSVFIRSSHAIQSGSNLLQISHFPPSHRKITAFSSHSHFCLFQPGDSSRRIALQFQCYQVQPNQHWEEKRRGQTLVPPREHFVLGLFPKPRVSRGRNPRVAAGERLFPGYFSFGVVNSGKQDVVGIQWL